MTNSSPMTKFRRVAVASVILLAAAPMALAQTKPVDQKASDELADRLMPKFNVTRSLKAPSGADVAPSDTVHFPVEFDSDSANLRPQGKKQLDVLAASMNKVRDRSRSLVASNQKLVLRLVGHTDDRGTEEHNDALSRDRAAAAKRYLKETWGFSDAEITTDHKGKSAPVNPAKPCDDACLQQNRRVDVQVYVQ